MLALYDTYRDTKTKKSENMSKEDRKLEWLGWSKLGKESTGYKEVICRFTKTSGPVKSIHSRAKNLDTTCIHTNCSYKYCNRVLVL